MIELEIPEMGKIPTLLITNGYEVRTAINNSVAASCNESNGCINIWINEEDIIVCELGKYRNTLIHDEYELDELDEVVKLFDDWKKQII